MLIDFEKLKTASRDELMAIALCEFSRFVDAIERIAPDQMSAAEEVPAACPHPLDARIDRSGMGQEPGSEFVCRACSAHVRGGVVVA
jgi:hypothetical protein